jgi:hypothetical protein
LVADRRTPRSSAQAGKPKGASRKASNPRARRKRTDARKTAPWPARLDRAAFGLRLRLLWGLAWRGGVAVR